MLKQPAQRALLAIIVLGGLAVVGSYVWGAASGPGAGDVLWGGVPDALRPLYTANMLLSALGFFFFATFILFRTGATTRVAGRWSPAVFSVLFLMILVPSALWMPLTLAMTARPSAALWGAICAALALVGLGALGVLTGLATVQPRRPTWHWALAVLGAIPFCVQTAVLDALVWTANFPH